MLDMCTRQFEEIKNELNLLGIKSDSYSIRPDGIVDTSCTVVLNHFTAPRFSVRFGLVKGSFYCDNTSINSLQGAPAVVCGNFYCSGTNITSLQGAPTSVGGGFNCSGTKITSLQGAPTSVGGGFYCYDTKIVSLQGIHKIVKQVNGTFSVPTNVTHVLGLLLIKGITLINVDNDGPIDKIMNKYLGTGDIISAQDELIDAGFKERAKL